MNLVARQRSLSRLGVFDQYAIAIDPEQFAFKRTLPVKTFRHCDLGFVSGPVGEVLVAGQRPVDPGRRHFEVIRPFDQQLARFLARIHHRGNRARQFSALLNHQLTCRRILSHDLQGLTAIASFGWHHLHAHEIETERFCLGLNQFGQACQIGHRSPLVTI